MNCNYCKQEHPQKDFRNREEHDKWLTKHLAGKKGQANAKKRLGDKAYSEIKSRASSPFWKSPEGEKLKKKMSDAFKK